MKNAEPGLTATDLGDDMSDATGRAVLDDLRRQIDSLAPGDIAEAIAFAVAAPARVNVAEPIVVPTRLG